MTRINRRTFMQHAGTAAALAVLSRTNRVWAAPAESAELALTGGAILTMNESEPNADAMAVRGGRILAVGNDEKIKALISKDTKVIDLGGKCVTPGLIDAHSHVIAFGHMELKFVIIRPPKINSFATLQQALAEAAKDKPKGEWIVARGFDTFKEGRFPRRKELDDAVPDHPLLTIHWSGQYGVANTAALKKAGLFDKNAKDPYGGKFMRGRDGLPDGVLIHYPAIYAVHQPEIDEQDQIECALWGFDQFVRDGVTCIHDNFCIPKHAKSYVRLERSGRMPCRLRVYPYVVNLEHCQELVKGMQRYEGPLLRMQGVKLAVDGYPLMYKPPPKNKVGELPMHPQPLFEQIIAAIHQAGFQADVHAVGDKGVDWTLGAFAKAAGSVGECGKRRHRIEHYPFRKMDSVKRTAELGVAVCVQPEYIRLKAADFAENFERELVETMVPLRTFTKEGVHVAYGADVPAFPSHSPLDSIRGAMDRKTEKGQTLDKSEAVSFMEALRHHTLGSAYAAFDEKDLGSLEDGKCADFVIWNRDLRKINKGKDLDGLQPQATYVSGKAVYEA